MEDYRAFLFRTWNECFMDGEWRPVDPTFDQPRAGATHISLLEGEIMRSLTGLFDLVGKLKAEVVEYD